MKQFKLIQEEYSDDPWKVVVCCICLNRTTGVAAKPVIKKLFETWPDPISMSWARESEMKHLIKSIGLVNVRYKALTKFSSDYVSLPLSRLRAMYGVGQYAIDAYNMVCLNNYSRKPTDRQLLKKWYQHYGI